jgi:hypothetical protein
VLRHGYRNRSRDGREEHGPGREIPSGRARATHAGIRAIRLHPSGTSPKALLQSYFSRSLAIVRSIIRKGRLSLAAVALLATSGVLSGCGGGGDAVAPPPITSTPPPAVSPDAQKKYARDVPNAGSSSSSGAVDSTLTGS